MKTNKFFTWVVFYLCVLVASSSGFIFPLGSANEWFSALNSPTFSPPNWVFGPVWTLLYLLIATSAFLIVQKRSEWLPLAIALWALQLALNVIWTPVFSGAQDLQLAFYYIVALWLSIVAYIFFSWRISRWASMIMIPYLCWVSFATALNFAYWQINI